MPNEPHVATKNGAAAKAENGFCLAYPALAIVEREAALIMETLVRDYMNSSPRRKLSQVDRQAKLNQLWDHQN